jgi:hypothetical protein
LLELVRKNAIELRSLKDKLHEQGLPVGVERSEAAGRAAQLLKWFLDQAQTGARAKFAPYLQFGMLR